MELPLGDELHGSRTRFGYRPSPGRPASGANGPGGHTSLQCLLDLDPDLADELDPDVRRAARAAATVVTFDVDAGELPLSDWLARAAPGPGLLALDGVLAVSVRVGDRVAADLLGAGDLLQPPGHDESELLCSEVGWRALVPMRFALLDEAFARRVRFWPQIIHALLGRAGRHVGNLNMQRAIASQPRLEVRLALLFWHLAARWGKVEPGGVRLLLPLTHQLLGRMIGAERPSVSHALARLATLGLVTGDGEAWHLHGTLGDQPPSMIQAASGPTERIVQLSRSPLHNGANQAH